MTAGPAPVRCAHSRLRAGCRRCELPAPPIARPAQAPVPLPCRHFGAATGETIQCPTCNGSVRLKTFGCAVYGACTPAKAVPGVACCNGCPDREAFAPVTRRNLLYHVYPVVGSVWRWNVQQLCRRMGLFNGRRIVAIATGPGAGFPAESRRGQGRHGQDAPPLDSAASVRAAFGRHDVEFVEVPNDAALGEVASFLPLFEAVESLDPSEATFYGHAKGVTRPPGHPAHPWAAMLYELYLDYWPYADRLLRNAPCAGAFKKAGRFWTESRSQWHYSGSFVWIRNRELFGRPDWRRIDRFWSGIEPYPSLHFAASEAAVIFMEGRGEQIQFYPTGKPNTGHDFIARTVQPALVKWRAERAGDYKEWPS